MRSYVRMDIFRQTTLYTGPSDDIAHGSPPMHPPSQRPRRYASQAKPHQPTNLHPTPPPPTRRPPTLRPPPARTTSTRNSLIQTPIMHNRIPRQNSNNAPAQPLITNPTKPLIRNHHPPILPRSTHTSHITPLAQQQQRLRPHQRRLPQPRLDPTLVYDAVRGAYATPEVRL